METEHSIDLYKYFKCTTLDSRDEATNLFAPFFTDCCVTVAHLDFNNIEFISRSFADQFIKEQKSLENIRSLRIEIVNAENAIIEMLQAVRQTYDTHRKGVIDFAIYTLSEPEKIEKYLLAI